MNIIQAITYDINGGAEKAARILHEAYNTLGHHSYLVVGEKRGDDPNTLVLAEQGARSLRYRTAMEISKTLGKKAGKIRGAYGVSRLAAHLAVAGTYGDVKNGKENFNHPTTWQLLDLIPQPPDIVHCHNLHGEFFDLRALAWLSQQKPVVMTLHDEWTFTGHCSYTLGCDRWEKGCGDCPDLNIYPSVPRDATAYNWQRKKDIYANSRLYVTTPSQWLMNKVNRSILKPGIVETRVIPYGIETDIFRPAERAAVRRKLGLPIDAQVLLFACNGFRKHRVKDYPTIREAVLRVVRQMPDEPIIFLGLGDNGPSEQLGRAEMRFVAYQKDPSVMALYYQSADIFLHAAKSDNLPLSITEAMACGSPVVATAVGGIPEQIRHGVDGFLTPAGNSEVMAESIVCLLKQPERRRDMASQAAEAGASHSLEVMVQTYLRYYEEIMSRYAHSVAGSDS